MTHPLVGHLAPDFTLTNQSGKTVTLSDLRGTPVLLIFSSFASSPSCTDEMRGIRDSAGLQKAGSVRVLVITCDSVHALKAWGDDLHYRGDLLSDFWPHGEVSRIYGVFNPRRGIAICASFLIAGDGVIRWAVVHAPEDPRSIDDYIEAIHEL